MTRLVARSVLAILVAVVLTQLASGFILHAFEATDVMLVMRGPSVLVERRLREASASDRDAAAEQLSREFGYPIEFQRGRHVAETHLEVTALGAILEAPMQDGSGALLMGPIPVWGSGQMHVSVLILPIVFATLVGLLIIVPLVRRIRAIEAVAQRVREGDFDARTDDQTNDALGHLARSLNLLAARIGQLVSDQCELMRTVAHEVRAPVARLRFRAAILSKELPDQRQRHFRGILADLAQVDALVTELMTYVAFDQYDQARPELRLSEIDVELCARDVVDRALVSEPATPIRVEVEVENDLTLVANPMLFERAVANVVENAVEHASSRVRLSASRDSLACTIHVDDDGPGIPESERRNVLKPFARLGGLGDARGGAGLGLAIVVRILALHGGEIEVEESPLGGTSVTLRWPHALGAEPA